MDNAHIEGCFGNERSDFPTPGEVRCFGNFEDSFPKQPCFRVFSKNYRIIALSTCRILGSMDSRLRGNDRGDEPWHQSHSREGGNPEVFSWLFRWSWMPAFAGMTGPPPTRQITSHIKYDFDLTKAYITPPYFQSKSYVKFALCSFTLL